MFGANRQHQYEILRRSASVCCNNAAVTIYPSGSEPAIAVFGRKTNNTCRHGEHRLSLCEDANAGFVEEGVLTLLDQRERNLLHLRNCDL